MEYDSMTIYQQKNKKRLNQNLEKTKHLKMERN